MAEEPSNRPNDVTSCASRDSVCADRARGGGCAALCARHHLQLQGHRPGQPPRSRAVASESEASRSDRKLHSLCSASGGRPLRDAFGPQPRHPGRLARVAAESANPWSHARRVGFYYGCRRVPVPYRERGRGPGRQCGFPELGCVAAGHSTEGRSGRRHGYRGRGPRSDFRRRSQQHPGQFNPRGLDRPTPGPDIHR